MLLTGESKAITSLIARGTAELCGPDQQKDLLATFFFSKSDPSRNSAKHFVPTLAYGIMQSLLISKGPITQAVERHPLMLSSSLEKQFDRLISDPLNQLLLNDEQPAENEDVALPYIIIIDALDECEDASERTRLLRLFERFYTTSLSSHNRKRPPWKVLVTSKPDQSVSEAFSSLPESMASHITLPEMGEEQDLMTRQNQAKKSPAGGNPALGTIPNPKSVSSKSPSRVQLLPSRGLRLLSIGVSK
jgi:hypothetical protein